MVIPFLAYRSAIFRHGIATLIAAAMAVVSVAIDTNREKNLDDQKMQAIVDGIADSIDRQLGAWRLALTAMSASNELNEPYDIEAFSTEAKKFAILTDTNIAFYRAERDGLTLISHTRLSSRELPIYFSADKIAIFFEAMSRVVATGLPTVSNLFLGPIAGEYLASIIVPKLQDKGSSELLSLNFSSRDLSEFLNRVILPDGFVVTVVDANGTVGGRSENADKFVGKSIPSWYHDVIKTNDHGIRFGDAMSGADYKAYRFVFRWLKEAKGWTVSLLVPPTAAPAIYIGTFSVLVALASFVGANSVAWLFGATQRQQEEVERRYQNVTHQLLDELPGAVLRGRFDQSGAFDVQLCLGKLRHDVVTAQHFKFEAALWSELKKFDRHMAASVQLEFDVRDDNRIFRLFVVDVMMQDHDHRDLNIYILDVTYQRSAEKAAINAERLAALGQMAATLAHEMSQPINVISLAADNADGMLQDKNLDGVLSKIKKIRDFAGKSRYLIDNLLAFARGDTPDTPLREADLNHALNLASDLTRSLLEREHVRLVLDIPKQPIWVRAQPIELENIFVNLFVNSVDAFKQIQREFHREISVHVRETHRAVTILVTDNAGGIPEALLSKIFEPFISSKSQGHGTGLGLAFVSGHIRSWGGEISVRNERDGAVFEIHLQAMTPRVSKSDQADAELLMG